MSVITDFIQRTRARTRVQLWRSRDNDGKPIGPWGMFALKTPWFEFAVSIMPAVQPTPVPWAAKVDSAPGSRVRGYPFDSGSWA